LEKNLLNSNISSTRLHDMVNFGPLMAKIGWRVWGTPVNFNGFRVLASLFCYLSMVFYDMHFYDMRCPNPPRHLMKSKIKYHHHVHCMCYSDLLCASFSMTFTGISTGFYSSCSLAAG